MLLTRFCCAAPAYAATSHDGAGQLMRLNREIAHTLVTRVQARGQKTPRILDIASGSGEPACTIANMLPSAEVAALLTVSMSAYTHADMP